MKEGIVYMLASTINDEAKPKAHQIMPKRHLIWDILHEEKNTYVKLGVKEGRGHLLEWGLFSRTYGMS